MGLLVSSYWRDQGVWDRARTCTDNPELAEPAPDDPSLYNDPVQVIHTHTVELEGFVASKFEGYVAKHAPHKALVLIA